VEELEKINARAEWKGNKNLTSQEPSLRKDIRGLHINKRLLSVEETAEYLGIAPQTLYNRISWKSRNPFPLKPKRVGRLVKFDGEELDAYVASL
jgi:excisionase family DNA binding protein